MTRIYRDMSGFAKPKIDDKSLEVYRTGYSPANPAGAQAMAREIDELRDLLKEAHSELRVLGSYTEDPNAAWLSVGLKITALAHAELAIRLATKLGEK